MMMNLILYIYLITAYFFSGMVCWLAVVNNRKHRHNLRWQSPLIVALWPLWILLEIRA